MRVVVISHSLCHKRQQLFFKKLSGYCQVLLISPRHWGKIVANSYKQDNFEVAVFDVKEQGNMKLFEFGDEAFQKVKQFKPNIIYSQTEVWQKMAHVSKQWAESIGCKFALFVWDNLNKPENFEEQLLDQTDLVIAGNSLAKELHNADTVMPQVGIDINIFKPLPIVKETKKCSMIFTGRPVKEKGVKYINKLENYFIVFYDRVSRAENVGYEEMPKQYNMARVQVVPSLTTDFWIEQWPACIAEGLACGIPAVCFDSGSIRDNYESCGAVKFVREGDFDELKSQINMLLRNNVLRHKLSKKGREWVVKNMSNKAVARKLISKFKKVVK